MKFVSTLLFACIVLGLARSEEDIPTEPGTLLEFKKKSDIIMENATLSVLFGKDEQPSALKVIPCYGLNIHLAAEIDGAKPQEDDITPTQNSFYAGFTSGPATLTIKSTSPDTDYTPLSGKFEALTGNSFEEIDAMCPKLTNPAPTFKINMKKKSDDNNAVVSWVPASSADVEYAVYRRDVKIGGAEPIIPEGVYETACGTKILFNEVNTPVTCEEKCSCSITGLKTDVISSVMIVATKKSSGCAVAYNRVNLNDGASALSCFMTIILFIVFYLFI